MGTVFVLFTPNIVNSNIINSNIAIETNVIENDIARFPIIDASLARTPLTCIRLYTSENTPSQHHKMGLSLPKLT